MDLELEFTGDVVERQELLNGTETVTVEGVTADGTWTLTSSFSWNLGLVDFPGEGDITLTAANGDELFASLTSAAVRETDAGHAFDLRFEFDGGSGRFGAAAGTADASGMLVGDEFRAHVRSAVHPA